MKTTSYHPYRMLCGGIICTSTICAVITLLLTQSGFVSATADEPKAQRNRLGAAEKGAARLMQRPVPEDLLPSATNCPVLAELTKIWGSLDRESLSYVTSRSNHAVKVVMHRIRKSDTHEAPVLVLIHGLVSDHRTWQYVAAELAENYEIWMVDLPGCGDSDAPKPSKLEPDGYSTTALGERVFQALQQCLQAQGGNHPRRITLVGHSLGGTVVIRMLSDPALRLHYQVVLQQVERSVLVAPCDLAVHAVPAQQEGVARIKDWEVWAGQLLGIVDPVMRKVIRDGYQLQECATIEAHAILKRALLDVSHRHAAQAMIVQAVPFDLKAKRPNWEKIEQLVAQYGNIDIPVLIVHGNRDETLSVAMGHKIKDEIPGAVLARVPGRSHALPSEDPLICASLIRRFQAGVLAEGLSFGLQAKIYRGSAVPDLNRTPWSSEVSRPSRKF